MTIEFLVDANLPEALARFLASKGVPSIHVADSGLRMGEDGDIWQYARDHDLVIVSKDVDFADRARHSQPGPAVVWVNMGNTRKQPLLERFECDLDDLLALLRLGDRLVEMS